MDRLRIEWHRDEDTGRPAVALTFQYRTTGEAADVLQELLAVLVSESLQRLETSAESWGDTDIAPPPPIAPQNGRERLTGGAP